MFTMKTILHPTDFSNRSKPAFDVACSLARDHAARLVVLHVIDTVDSLSAALSAAERQQRVEHECEVKLHKLRPDDESIVVEYRQAAGDPADIIPAIATEYPNGLIVMGTHGRTGLTRALMGSIAEAVVRHATCPVLTVKSPEVLSAKKQPPAVPTTTVPVM